MARILVVGVNPFEDLPGYQLLSILGEKGEHEVAAADDSKVAVKILRQTGTDVHKIPHPIKDSSIFTSHILDLCDVEDIDIMLPSTDATQATLMNSVNEEDRLHSLYPPLSWLSDEGLENKWLLQEWMSGLMRTPRRRPIVNGAVPDEHTEPFDFPVLVKGIRKGAFKCKDELEIQVSHRWLLENPANQGSGEGAFVEEIIEGDEYACLMMLDGAGKCRVNFSIRKLATTQLGTTQFALVQRSVPAPAAIGRLIKAVRGPMVLEVEFRVDEEGIPWAFEMNPRFPSWIGAIGEPGVNIVHSFIDSLLGEDNSSQVVDNPQPGTYLYRLPECGVFPLVETFQIPDSPSHTDFEENSLTNRLSPKKLWPSGTPHQFLSK